MDGLDSWDLCRVPRNTISRLFYVANCSKFVYSNSVLYTISDSNVEPGTSDPGSRCS